METTTTTNPTNLPSIQEAQKKFELACKTAEGLQTVNNYAAAFQAASVVSLLRDAMTDEVMEKIFMPLMNTKVGFLTDHTGKPRGNRPALPPYSKEIVRDAIVDAVSIGLMPTGNQFNIIAERMYPTKEGYTALLRKLGVKYVIDTSYDKSQTKGFAEIPCKIAFEYQGEKNSFTIVATVKKDDFSSPDQLRGKAERRAKKALYEYITGCDLGDADEDSSTPIDTAYTEIQENANQGKPLSIDPGNTPAPEPQTPPQSQPQTQTAPQTESQPNIFNQQQTPGF